MTEGSNDKKAVPELLPNQVENLRFSLEQLRELSSPMRAAVFWSFHAYIRKSVNDIAKELGKSAQTIHYHVNELLKIELIVPAETRKRRSRTEQLYVRKARVSNDPVTGVSEEYNRYRVRGFKFETQKILKETSFFYGLLEHEPSAAAFGAYRKSQLVLSPERAKKLERDMRTLLMDAFNDQTLPEEGGGQVSVVLYMKPTLFQMKIWAKEAGINFESLSRDGLVEVADEGSGS